MTSRKIFLGAAVLIIAAVALWFGFRGGEQANAAGPFSHPREIQGQGGAIAVERPDRLSQAAERGAAVFNENCAACHGEDAAGTANGPPLAHVIYEPNHHGDGAFYSAVLNGVRAHHWRYGNMAPVAGVAEAEIADIIAYVRTVQRANGVE